jgi:hypothetical protein
VTYLLTTTILQTWVDAAQQPNQFKYDALLTQIAAAAGVEIGNIGPEPKDFVVM